MNSHAVADDEQGLVLAAQGGDVAAFGELVRKHQAHVRALLMLRLESAHDVEDLMQEVFITAFRKLPTCDPARPLWPWLRGIAVHLVANHLRKFRATPIGLSEELQTMLEAGLDDLVAAGEDTALEALRECLEELDEPSRDLLQARYTEGVSIEELAGRLGRKASAVTMQLHRLRVQLADCIQRKLAPGRAVSGPDDD